MIKLDSTVKTFWHPDGDKDGNPLKVDVDHFQITLVRADYMSGILEVCGVHGYLQNGIFHAHISSSGTIDMFSKVIARDGPDSTEWSDFLSGISAKGAPHGNFRLTDIEDLLIQKGHVKGTKN
jgi:hypothetical protein